MAGSTFRIAGLLALFLGSVEGRLQYYVKDATPGLPSDPSTISTCTWWWDNVDGAIACADMPSEWGISMEDFLRWGRSYCVEAPSGGNEPGPTITTSNGEKPTPTGGNGVETPLPTQPGMVDNCNKFYFAKIGDTCAAITSKSGISQQQLRSWNPSLGDDCSGLWADTYVCVGRIGATTTSAPTTTTGNGIATPTPTQPGMVDNCDEFCLTKVGDTCAGIAILHKISQKEFQSWNPSVGSDCSGLWANTYVCIHRIGTPTNPPVSTTTTSGNGVATPTPIQPGMVKNCGKFHFVVKGDICASIASKYNITVPNFIKWNPAVKKDCTGIWAETYACVGLI